METLSPPLPSPVATTLIVNDRLLSGGREPGFGFEVTDENRQLQIAGTGTDVHKYAPGELFDRSKVQPSAAIGSRTPLVAHHIRHTHRQIRKTSAISTIMDPFIEQVLSEDVRIARLPTIIDTARPQEVGVGKELLSRTFDPLRITYYGVREAVSLKRAERAESRKLEVAVGLRNKIAGVAMSEIAVENIELSTPKGCESAKKEVVWARSREIDYDSRALGHKIRKLGAEHQLRNARSLATDRRRNAHDKAAYDLENIASLFDEGKKTNGDEAEKFMGAKAAVVRHQATRHIEKAEILEHKFKALRSNEKFNIKVVDKASSALDYAAENIGLRAVALVESTADRIVSMAQSRANNLQARALQSKPRLSIPGFRKTLSPERAVARLDKASALRTKADKLRQNVEDHRDKKYPNSAA